MDLDTLAKRLAVLAMDGGGSLPDERASAVEQALGLIEPMPRYHDGHVLAAQELHRIAGDVPIADGTGGFRPATTEERSVLEDEIAGGVWEKSPGGLEFSGRPDAYALEQLRTHGVVKGLREQRLLKCDSWTVAGRTLLADGLTGVRVREHDGSLTDVLRAGLPAHARWSATLPWPTLLAALPARLDRVAGPGLVFRPRVHELLRCVFTCVLGNRSFAPEVCKEPVQVVMTGRALWVSAPGGPLRWSDWEGDGPKQATHRNPQLAAWLARCCEDYGGAVGITHLASELAMAVTWKRQGQAFSVTLSRDRVLQAAKKRARNPEVDEQLVLFHLRRLGGEARRRELATATAIPRSTLMEAIDRLVQADKVERTEVARRSRKQRYVLVEETG